MKTSHKVATAVGTVAAACGVLTGVGFALHPVHQVIGASWAGAYPSFSQMSQHADAVVRGHVLRSLGAQKNRNDGTIYSDFTFAVTKWIAGEPAGTAITLHQMGGSKGFIQEDVEDDPLLAVGENDLLFLKTYAPGKYFVLGGPTGRLLVKGNTVTHLPGGVLVTKPSDTLTTVEAALTKLAAVQGKASSASG